MRRITTLDLQYAHRFYGFKGEAHYLHGHTGVLTIKMVYDLLKDKLNIAKITFTSGANAASAEVETHNQIDRCPLCGIALNENGVCPKCGYKKG